jgi:tripartite-type tricarboxylate transporter receptor subunit TctC
MFMVRRAALVMIASAMAMTAGPSQAGAWPQRAVRIIMPLVAGGGTDLAARLFAERLSERWRQPVVVENRPGPDGIVGVTGFVNSRDEHTLLFSNAGPISINPLIHQNLPYDPARDLVPIASAIDNFFAVAVSSSVGVDSISAFVALARREPRRLNWTATAGLPQYIFAALQKSQGLEMTYVPYRDFAQALQDVGEGRVHAVATAIPLLLPQVQLGKVKLLMVTNRERSSLAADVPTAKEAGYPELLFEGVVGFYGWRDIPADLRASIAADIRAVAADTAMTARLRSVGVAVRAGTSAEFAADIEAQREKIATLLQVPKPAN